jgi:hypothetical protein
MLQPLFVCEVFALFAAILVQAANGKASSNWTE